MTSVNLWMLVFVMLNNNGDVVTQQMDIYGNIDDCMYAAADYAEWADNPLPLNWDFVCLEMEAE